MHYIVGVKELRSESAVTSVDVPLCRIHVAVMDGQMNIISQVFSSDYFNVNTPDMSGETRLLFISTSSQCQLSRNCE
jgi:hypothetical protein